jgi:hypothetical protein
MWRPPWRQDLVIEMCAHAALPGQIDPLLRLLRDRIVPLRQQHGARLLFVTVGDSGRLGEVVTAWAHDSHTEFARFDEALEGDPSWQSLAPEMSGHTRAQTRQMLRITNFTSVALPPERTRLIDLRIYSFKPGALAAFLPVCAGAGLPGQRRHCRDLVFHATSISGPSDQLVQAWAYENHAQYDAGQRALFKDPSWALDYRQRVIHLVAEQEHRYLQTLPWSPTAPRA